MKYHNDHSPTINILYPNPNFYTRFQLYIPFLGDDSPASNVYKLGHTPFARKLEKGAYGDRKLIKRKAVVEKREQDFGQ